VDIETESFELKVRAPAVMRAFDELVDDDCGSVVMHYAREAENPVNFLYKLFLGLRLLEDYRRALVAPLSEHFLGVSGDAEAREKDTLRFLNKWMPQNPKKRVPNPSDPGSREIAAQVLRLHDWIHNLARNEHLGREVEDALFAVLYEDLRDDLTEWISDGAAWCLLKEGA
jgi:hypothetical protein